MDEELEFEEVDYSSAVVKPWRKIIKTVLKDKKTALGMVISVILLAIIDVCYPLLNQYAIHQYLENTDPNRFDNTAIFIVGYVLVAIAYGLIIFSFLHFACKVEVNTSYQLRKEAYLKLQQLPFSYFDQTPQGWIMARMTSDARKLSSILSWGFVDLVWGGLTMIGILVILLIKNPMLSLIIIALIPFLGGFALYFRKKILVCYRDARKINSKITASYNEGFMGSKTTKSLVIEEKNKKEFHEKSFNYRKSSLRAVIFSSLFGPVIFILGYIGVGGTLYAGGILVLGGTLLISELYIFVEYTIKFFDPVMSVSRVLGDFQQAQASAERIISLIEYDPEIKDTDEVIEKYGTAFQPKRENWEELKGEIDFKNVTFKYNKGETVLKDFNLHINAGETVALVGHTGSGKSTIVNLICRFYEPSSGEILIDGKNYKDRSIGWLHSNLGYVLQSPQLFSGTIMENIRYGRLTATDEEVYEAAKTVNAAGFIDKLDKGYSSEVGEGGAKLSLGERQLISFARAVVANPKILVLDEATSSIDTQTEHLIQHAVNVVLKGRTSFMIAHRLSTVVNADLILVMSNGEVVESGKHHELLMKKGYYFELYKNQFIKEKESQIIN